MEVDPEEVKRHLDILGYTHIEPNLLNEFVEDLKKIIEYDRRHNNVISVQSTSLNKDWDLSYSERMQSSTPIDKCTGNPNKASIDRSRARGEQEWCHPINTKRNNQNCVSLTSSKIIDLRNKTSMNKSSKCETEFMQPKCYFCGSIPMENQQTMKVKRRSNPLHTLHFSVAFGIDL